MAGILYADNLYARDDIPRDDAITPFEPRLRAKLDAGQFQTVQGVRRFHANSGGVEVRYAFCRSGSRCA